MVGDGLQLYYSRHVEWCPTESHREAAVQKQENMQQPASEKKSL